MKRKFALYLVLLSVFQMGWAMEEEVSRKGIIEEENKVVINQSFSFTGMMHSGLNTLTTGFSLGLNYVKKQVDPVEYSTSDNNIELVKFATKKFIAAKTIEDLKNLQNFVPTEKDDLKITGNLFKKVGDRNTSFVNVMTNELIRLSDGTYEKLDKLNKEQFATRLLYYKGLRNEVYNPAIENMHKALSAVYEENLNALIFGNGLKEENGNQKEEIQEEEK